jgi:hypothetical protein
MFLCRERGESTEHWGLSAWHCVCAEQQSVRGELLEGALCCRSVYPPTGAGRVGRDTSGETIKTLEVRHKKIT